MEKFSVIIQTGKIHVYAIILLGCLFSDVTAQENVSVRKISVNREDTMVLAGILTGKRISTPRKNAFYYWYSSFAIHMNKGGYSGNLLHGEYLELDILGNMIVKGYFQYGLQHNYWRYWYPDGNAKETTKWNKGLKSGLSLIYSPSGDIVFKGKYKNGEKKGVVFFVENDIPNKAFYYKGKEKFRKPLIKEKNKSDDEG